MDAPCAIAHTSGGAAGEFNVCFPAAPAVETPKEPPWCALTPEEWAQQLGHGFGILWFVSMLFHTQCSYAGIGVKVNCKFAVLFLLELGSSASLYPQVTALSSFSLLLINL